MKRESNIRNQKKIISIVGARPQLVKLAMLSRAIRKHFNEIILHTGQHYSKNMSDTFFRDLEIPAANYNLNIGSGSHGMQTGKMLIGIEKVLLAEIPDCVIVFGDTNTTVAGALAASKLHIPVIHVEAGLRSFNRVMPEEINRVISDHISDHLFCPTPLSMKNIESEGLQDKSYLTGDIMADALKSALNNIKMGIVLEKIGFKNDSYYLLTLHRPYNVDNEKVLGKILNDLNKLDKNVIFPVHPRTKKVINQNSIPIGEKIYLIEPVSYIEFLDLQMNSFKVITDSGGVQKEAYLLGKPCITIRSETEWVETVESGWNLLLDVNDQKFIDKISNFTPTGKQMNIFGNNVAHKMIEIMKSILL